MPKHPIHETTDTPAMPRRHFLGVAAMAGAATFAAPALLRGRNLNDKLNIAVVGVGGRGASNLQAVASENIVALCDVNADNLGRAAKAHPRRAAAPTFANSTNTPTSSTPSSSAPANTRTPSRRCRPCNLASTCIAKSP